MPSNSTNKFFAAWLCVCASCASPSPSPVDPVAAPIRDGCADPPENSLKIVSFNIHAGRTAPIDQIAGLLREIDPDFVFVQEVDVGVRRTGNVDQFKVLKDALPGREGHFLKTLDYQGGDYGVAVFSRGTLGEIHLEDLPWDDERRVLVRGVWHFEGAEIPFVAGHLGGAPSTRDTQFRHVVNASKDAQILLGDFNSTPQELPNPASLGWNDAFASEGKMTANIRGEERRIDYIWTRMAPVCARVVETPVSDHFPLVLTVSANH